MKNSRLDNRRAKEIASDLSLPVEEVRRAVGSFFGSIVSYSRSLPFDNKHKIFKKETFDSYVKVFNIPYIGRMGPVYSRYLTWRKNEAAKEQQILRSVHTSKWSQDDIEKLAELMVSGETVAIPEKRKRKELYDKVWIVDNTGKKLARQAIQKQ